MDTLVSELRAPAIYPPTPLRAQLTLLLPAGTQIEEMREAILESMRDKGVAMVSYEGAAVGRHLQAYIAARKT